MFEIAFSVEPFAGVWRVLATVSVWGFGIEFRPLEEVSGRRAFIGEWLASVYADFQKSGKRLLNCFFRFAGFQLARVSLVDSVHVAS